MMPIGRFSLSWIWNWESQQPVGSFTLCTIPELLQLQKKEIEQAKLRLTVDEFATLEKYIANDLTLRNSHLFGG